MAETVITTHKDPRLGEVCHTIRHASGLTILVWYKPEYRSAYALFATRYGSIDTSFWVEGDSEPTVVPAGIALYWIASNLLAILQQILLNAMISPKKYVDYKALEESRRALASIEKLDNGRAKALKKREKQDLFQKEYP